MNPPGHIRTPWYLRGKMGEVERRLGAVEKGSVGEALEEGVVVNWLRTITAADAGTLTIERMELDVQLEPLSSMCSRITLVEASFCVHIQLNIAEP